MNSQDKFKTHMRNLSVLFCDLKDSTRLSQQLSLCDYLEILLAYQETCAEIAKQFDGYVAQFLGDGLLVYFGYPDNQQNDASQAVQAGIEIIKGVEKLNLETINNDNIDKLAVRLGIATGTVMMAELGGGNKLERLAIGMIPNMAARLQSLATENSIVFCPDTYQRIKKYFNCEYLGFRNLKGISHPVEVYQVFRDF